MRRTLKEAPFVVGVIVVLAAAVFVVLVWQGHFVHDGVGPAATQTTATEPSATPPAETHAAPAATAPTTTSTAPAASRRPPRRSAAPAATRPAPASVTLATVVVTARRGDCWVSLRQGSGTGKIYFEGTLARGKSVQASGARIWLRLGAAGNVDVTLNGAPVSVPAGTSARVLTAGA